MRSTWLPVLLAALCQPVLADQTLDPLHLDGLRIFDSSHRAMVLRGVVTITGNNDGRPMVMTPADYQRIRGWGFNVQQIRLEGRRLGLLPPCKAEPDYLDKLESWVNMAQQQGIYSIFKATTYDVPGLSFRDQFKPGAWDKLWDVKSGYQDQFIAAWTRLWQRFKDRPAVVGYDFLNECSPGSNTPGFYHNYLLPFYRRGQAALGQVDSRQFFIFQPSLRGRRTRTAGRRECRFRAALLRPDARSGRVLPQTAGHRPTDQDAPDHRRVRAAKHSVCREQLHDSRRHPRAQPGRRAAVRPKPP